jgi:hypothetical protein
MLFSTFSRISAFSIVSLCSTMLAMPCAFAQVPLGTLKGDFISEYKDMTFSYDERVKSYVLTELVTHVWGQGTFSGVLKAMSRAETFKVDQTVRGIIGKQISGYSRIVLENFNGNIRLVYRTKVADSVAGFPLVTNANFALPMRLVKGTWKDYQDGKSVELDLTPEGVEIYNQEVKKALTILVDNAATQQYQDFDVAGSIDSVRLTNGIHLQANLKQITFAPLNTEYLVSVALGM